jgi:rhodanese-related sulfurtransferase
VLSGGLSRLPHSPTTLLLPFEITPQDVRQQFETASVVLIDVREPHEYQTARIEGSELIPMRSVPARVAELEDRAADATLIVYCHHGVRSLQVVNWLREQGVEACQSMAGGIDRWSLEIDPSVPRY